MNKKTGLQLRCGTAEEAGMSTQRVQYVVDLAKGWVDQGFTPALVVLVARRGIIVIHEAFGCLTPDQDSPPLKLDTIFPMSSITKSITATAAMILVEDGLLGLNRPVSWYIPEFVGEGKEAVMVHHLLTHTSGLRDEEAGAHAEKKKDSVEIPTPDETQHPLINEYLFLRWDAPLWKHPGVEMSYCNYNYGLVGEIVRRISGSSLDDFTRERIFKPLGMNDTFYGIPDSICQRIVQRPADGPFADHDSQIFRRCGGVFSTAMDMAIFGQMFLNRGTYRGIRILSPASVDAMTRNQIPGIGAKYKGSVFPEASWGLGWNVCGNKKSLGYAETLQSPEAFSHGGSGGVFLWMDPVYEILGIYFSVASKGGISTLERFEESFHIDLMRRVDLLINTATATIIDL